MPLYHIFHEANDVSEKEASIIISQDQGLLQIHLSGWTKKITTFLRFSHTGFLNFYYNLFMYDLTIITDSYTAHNPGRSWLSLQIAIGLR